MVRPCSTNGIEVDAKTKENTRKTEEKLDGRNKEGHARKLRGLSPRANYTDRAAAAGRRS